MTRRDAFFVNHGPYRWVRNPMYAGILWLGMSLGLALTSWLLPVATSDVFVLLALRTRTEDRVVFGNIIKVVMGNGYIKIREVS